MGFLNCTYFLWQSHFHCSSSDFMLSENLKCELWGPSIMCVMTPFGGVSDEVNPLFPVKLDTLFNADYAHHVP